MVWLGNNKAAPFIPGEQIRSLSYVIVRYRSVDFRYSFGLGFCDEHIQKLIADPVVLNMIRFKE